MEVTQMTRRVFTFAIVSLMGLAFVMVVLVGWLRPAATAKVDARCEAFLRSSQDARIAALRAEEGAQLLHAQDLNNGDCLCVVGPPLKAPHEQFLEGLRRGSASATGPSVVIFGQDGDVLFFEPRVIWFGPAAPGPLVAHLREEAEEPDIVLSVPTTTTFYLAVDLRILSKQAGVYRAVTVSKYSLFYVDGDSGFTVYSLYPAVLKSAPNREALVIVRQAKKAGSAPEILRMIYWDKDAREFRTKDFGGPLLAEGYQKDPLDQLRKELRKGARDSDSR